MESLISLDDELDDDETAPVDQQYRSLAQCARNGARENSRKRKFQCLLEEDYLVDEAAKPSTASDKDRLLLYAAAGEQGTVVRQQFYKMVIS